jgi:hypothetical protein
VSKTRLLLIGLIGGLLILLFLSVQFVLSLKLLAWCIAGVLVAGVVFLILFSEFEIVLPLGPKKRR